MLKVDEVWQIVSKLPAADRVTIARKALVSAAIEGEGDEHMYNARPVTDKEFAVESPDPLSWESEGWEDVK